MSDICPNCGSNWEKSFDPYCYKCLQRKEKWPILERSLDDIWNAILDVKDELKAINAELSKSQAARENDRLRTKLVNEGKAK